MNLLYFLLMLLGSALITHVILVPLVEGILLAFSLLIINKLNRSKNSWLTIMIFTPAIVLLAYLYVLGNATVVYFTLETFSALWVKMLLVFSSAVWFSRFIDYKIRVQKKESLKDKRNSDEIFEFYDYQTFGISAVIITSIIIFIWPEAFEGIFKWPYTITRSFW